MKIMHRHLHLLLQNEKGATALEYGLMVALIAAVLLFGITALGTSLIGLFNTLTSSF